jgi:hypothetical protein
MGLSVVKCTPAFAGGVVSCTLMIAMHASISDYGETARFVDVGRIS